MKVSNIKNRRGLMLYMTNTYDKDSIFLLRTTSYALAQNFVADYLNNSLKILSTRWDGKSIRAFSLQLEKVLEN